MTAGAHRDLSQFAGAEVPFAVTVELNVPMGTFAAGVEETPPAGWTISNISAGGSVDPATGDIKWGPFFDPSIPSMVTYDATAPDGAGTFCFTGTVSFDGPPEPIAGDECVGVNLPAVTTWGSVVLSLLLLCFGTALARRRLVRPCPSGSRSLDTLVGSNVESRWPKAGRAGSSVGRATD